MKNNILKFLSIFLIIIITLIFYLSLIGIETKRFNEQIKNRIIKTNNSLDLDLKKIKLRLDLINFKFDAKTVGAVLYYSKKPLPLEYIKTQISFASLINNKIIFSNLEVSSRSILLKNLIGFVRTINNSPQLFILEKITNKGQIIFNLDLNFDELGNLKNDYKINGSLKDGKIGFSKGKSFENFNFNFDLKKDKYLFEQVKFKTNNINFISEKIKTVKKDNSYHVETILENNNSKLNNNILKLLNIDFKNIDIENINFSSKNKISIEIDRKFNLKNTNLKSDITINEFKYEKPNLISDYVSNINDEILFKDHNLKLDYKNNKLLIEGNGKIQLNKKLDKIEYSIIKNKDLLKVVSKLNLEKFTLKKQNFLNNYFPNISDKIIFKDQILNINYKENALSLSGKGKVKIDEEFENIDFNILKNSNKFDFDIGLNLNQTNFEINQLNYQKKIKSDSKIRVIGNFEKNKNLNLNKINIIEEKNYIKINNLVLGNDLSIINVSEANFNYIDIENKQNQFNIKKLTNNNYELEGLKLNANTLISNSLDEKNKKVKKLFHDNLNLNLNISEVFIDKFYFVKNLKGKLSIQRNKIANANISANFSNKRKDKIIFSVNTDTEGNKITSLTSSWAKPLVSRYKFIKGFEDDKESFLDFYSSKKNGISSSSLIIDNFKVKEIPALAKLLALASLQGIADLLTGEGIRFTDFEMKFTNENNVMKIDELYAIGPAISILLDGYIETNNLISLRGTLVPATTINRSIASIPVIGDFLIGKKVGEGVFGVSFKIKGPPKNLETTVNPIKTLTPRFITRTLEKIKKN